jgi:hypothetical protein
MFIEVTKQQERVAILLSCYRHRDGDGIFVLKSALYDLDPFFKRYDYGKWSEDLQSRDLIRHRAYKGHFELTETGLTLARFTR